MQSVKAEVLYTGTCVVNGAYLAFEEGEVTGVFDEPRGEVIGQYPVLTPALIDPHSHIGMVRSGEPESEAEANDRQESLLVLPDALDSLQMDDSALREAVEAGVLYSCIVPGSGNILAGRSAVVRNYALDSSGALVERAGLKAAMGYNPMSTTEWRGTRPTTRMGAMALLRGKLEEVARKEKRYQEADEQERKKIAFTAEGDALREVLAGRSVLRVHAHKIDDIAALLRLVDEYGLKVTVEHAMGVDQPQIFNRLRERGIPVVYGPLDAFAYKPELRKESWRNARHLLDSGVEFAMMSDHPVTPSRQLFLQSRWFLRLGRSAQEVVELVTRKNAEVLGVQDRLGTLEAGKWASFVGWSGDPLYLGSYPAAVYGEGELLHAEEGGS